MTLIPSGCYTAVVGLLVSSLGRDEKEREMKMNTKDNEYQKEKTRVAEMVGFYGHLGAYVLVNSLLFLIDILTPPDILWFYWPLLGWGIGIVMHAAYVFGLGRWFGSDWEEKRIKESTE
jgi:hypothetical protein